MAVGYKLLYFQDHSICRFKNSAINASMFKLKYENPSCFTIVYHSVRKCHGFIHVCILIQHWYYLLHSVCLYRMKPWLNGIPTLMTLKEVLRLFGTVK